MRELNSERNPGQSDIIRWLRDDVGMSEEDAHHTVDLINNGEKLNPPLVLSSSDHPWLRTGLYYFSRPVVRALSGFIGLAFLLDTIYSEYQERAPSTDSDGDDDSDIDE
jgi:hypothetical protein